MTQSQAKELFIIIRNWCYQQYNEKVAPGLPPKEYGTRIFELLPKYKESFPQSCFYTGIIYRKKDQIVLNSLLLVPMKKAQIQTLV